MAQLCPSCGYQNREGARFCHRCGGQLAIASQVVTELRPFHETPIRCHKCRDEENVEVCHVCGRLVCAAHEARPTLLQTFTQEFIPALPAKHSHAVHCEHDPHFLKSPLRSAVIPGLVLIIIGLWVGSPQIRLLAHMISSDVEYTFSVWVTRVVTLLLSLAAIGGGIGWAIMGARAYFETYRFQVQGPVLNAAPIIPEQYIVQIQEHIDLDLNVDETVTPYQKIRSAGGEISIQALIPESVPQAVQAYYEKCSRNRWPHPVEFNLGFLAVNQLAVIEIPIRERMTASPNVMPLRLALSDLANIAGWRDLLHNSYVIKPASLFPDRDKSLPERSPVWVKPVIKPNSAGRTLQFMFEFAPELRGDKTLRHLSLSIPPSAFANRGMRHPITTTNGRFYDTQWEVQWIDWNLSADEHMHIPEVTFPFALSEMGQPFQVTFEIEISGVTLSQIEIKPEHIWLPNGRRIQAENIGVSFNCKTTLKGNVTVNPAVFSHQYEAKGHETFKLDRPALSAPVIEHISRKLEEQEVYVRRVTQYPPVSEPHDTMIEKHTWDILGRRYIEIYPIDVHVLLTEYRPLSSQDHAKTEPSQIMVEVVLRVLVNTKNPEFERHVVDQAQALKQALQQILTSGA